MAAGVGWLERTLGRFDTLGTRLFLLMWAALVLSHVAAFLTVTRFAMDPPGARAGGPGGPPPPGAMPMPTFPSLPPPPRGLQDTLPGEPGGRGPGLPIGAWLLDYGVRLLVIALAAALGARWLARPVRRLVQASERLADGLDDGRREPPLDEHAGTREVREAASVFNRMAARLREQFEQRGLMVAAISHDLRTPLTRMRLRLETEPVPPPLRDRCVQDIGEMNALIDGVLEVFRPPEAHGEWPRIDLAAVAQAAVDDLAETGAAVSFDGGPAVVRADAVALRRIVDNLVGNALRYAGSARVSVAVEPGGAAVLRIDDDGPGIPDEELERVMQPFRRLEGSRNRLTGGVGLGLYIAGELCRRQQAALRLMNRPEGGLRAEIRWRA